MLRLALTPRWLLGAVVLMLLVVGAVLLGRWQWDRTQAILAAERAAVAESIPVQDVFADSDPGVVPAEGIGRPVTATGSFDPAMQSVVSDRLHEGSSGVWIVTGLRLANGQVAAVLRGSLPTATSPGAEVAAGAVTVDGVLQPDEDFYADADSAPGTVAAIAHERLATEWGTDVLPGYIALVSVDPAAEPAPVPVPVPVQSADVPFPVQNFFYAFQWWIFAAFGVVIFLRWLWLESRRSDEVAVP